MVFRGEILVSFILLLSEVALSYDYQVTRPSDDEDTQSSFAKLLNTIVRVNEERMDAVRKITQLQDYMFTKNKLKADDDAYDSLEEEDNRVLWAFDDIPKRRKFEEMTRRTCGKLFLENHLRLWNSKLLKKSCFSPKQSVEFCIEACNTSFTNVCEKLQCNSVAKRDFRTECYDNCRSLFESDDE
ncbi:uncharacterized protein LOC113505194 [Trichoplusia ni]|uniref:Uncharacterized protein LOC113505194 n=1 Tax=Trichoplusia ni TaxID=7111 RepID=A0A7E5WTG8_TRINI|nr:uncharacterized protein LOC113505194 [Trichoplusia ni]